MTNCRLCGMTEVDETQGFRYCPPCQSVREELNYDDTRLKNGEISEGEYWQRRRSAVVTLLAKVEANDGPEAVAAHFRMLLALCDGFSTRVHPEPRKQVA